MKKILMVLIASVFTLQINAQQIAYSEPFEEIRGTWMDELIVLKNGTTALISISEDDGIAVSLYNQAHKLVTKSKTANDAWTERKLSASTYKGTYEINGNIVVFISQLNRGNMQSFHRLVISSETGKLLSGDKIGEIPTRRAWGNDAAYGIVVNDYYVAVDPVTQGYAILAFEGYTTGKEDRLRVMVYDKTHKLVKEAAVGKEVNSKRFTKYAGMCMQNNDVFIGSSEYDPKSTSPKTPFYISVLRNDATAFVTRKVEVPLFRATSNNQIMFNAGNNMLQMVTKTETGSDTKGRFGGYSTTTTYFAVYISFIDAATLQVVTSRQYTNVKADEYARTKLGDMKGFKGALPEMFINYDYSTTLKASDGKAINGTNYSNQIGMTYLDKEDREQDAYVMNVPEIAGNIYTRGTGGGVYDTYFISTKNGDYILMNDLPENFDKSPKETPHKLSTISDANTIANKLTNGKVEKTYLYGPPKDKKSCMFTKFNTVFYNKELNVLAVLMDKNDRGDIKSHIAWIEL